MKQITLSLAVLCLVLLHISSFAQPQFRSCGSMEVLNRQLKENPALQIRMDQIEQFTNSYIAKQKTNRTAAATVSIPVVVHVLYNTTGQNVGDAQVRSQIDILNRDFAKLNSDTAGIPPVFRSVAANTGIQFCLAQRDPNGNATSGIIHKQTTNASFTTDDAVKKSSNGGDDPWDATKYLNIWVCYLSGNLLGYAQLPGGIASTDGVVITYTAFGDRGTAVAPYNMGRTATHEVGHWLNLRHIWGDANCGDDFVGDTPTQQTANYGCPVWPHVTCTNSGDMSMNYMDYSDDRCMFMFSSGQSARMNALFAPGGARASILSSLGCVAPATCAIPAGLTATSITQVSATLNWTAVTSSTGYTIQYKAGTASTWTTLTSATTSVNLSGLTAGTSYQFQVQTTCSSGTSAYSAVATFTTSPVPGNCVINAYEPNNTMSQVAGIPVGTDVKGMIETASDIDWYGFANTSAQPNIQVTLTNLPKDYTLQLYKGGTQLAISSNTGTTSETITYNTTAVGTYWVRVNGNSANYSNASCYTLKVMLSSGTPTLTCDVPSGLSSSSVTQSSATVSWGAVTNATGYVIQYRVKNAASWLSTKSAVTSAALSGLTASTMYEFQVSTTCTSGSSAFSASGTFTTAAPPTNTGCTVNAYEPNNTMSQLAPITANTAVNAMIEAASDVDWFSFTNTSAQPNIQVRLYNLPKDYSLALYKSGTMLASSANTGTADELIKYNTAVVGTYWVRVYGSSSAYSNTQCYSLQASTSSAPFFAENTPATADERQANKKEVQVFPNPSTGDFTIQYNAPASGQLTARIIDLAGNVVYTNIFELNEGGNAIPVSLQNMAKGMYLLDLNDGTENTVHKIVIR